MITNLARSAAVAGLAALLCTGLAACSGSGGGTTATPTHNPPAGVPSSASPAAARSVAASGSACGLVTVSEVAAATGKPMAAGNGTGSICSYSATADPSLVVYVQIYPDTQSMAVPKQVEAGSAHLHGLGNDAFWNTAGILFVQKGSRAFSISIPSLALTSRTAPPAIVALATAALARF
jgi:hypothetical protein